MASKRYGIVFPEAIYRQIKTNAMLSGQTIGEYITNELQARGVEGNVTFTASYMTGEQGPEVINIGEATPEQFEQFKAHFKEASMVEEPAKKAIEPDKVEVTDKGKLTKGLGEVPGITRQQRTDEILNRINKEKKK